MAFVVVEQTYEMVKYLIFGPSDLSFVLKKEKSMGVFMVLIGIIIFRQKYEL